LRVLKYTVMCFGKDSLISILFVQPCWSAASNGTGQTSGSQGPQAFRSGQNAKSTTPSNADAAGNAASTSVPRELEPRRLLNTLAKEARLPDLLKPEFSGKLAEMGIPRGQLEALMREGQNHGVGGLEAVRKLLFLERAPLPTPQQRQWQPRQMPSGYPAPPGPHQQQQQNQQPTPQKPPFVRAATSVPPSQPSTISAGTARPSGATPSAERAQEGSSSGSSSSRPSIRDLLDQQGVIPPAYAPGTYRMVCPKCKGGSGQELSFSITIDESNKSAVWHCFRATCAYAGAAHVEKPRMPVNQSGYFVPASGRKRKSEAPVRPTVKLEPLTPEMSEFFASRGISSNTLERNHVSSQLVYDPGAQQEARVIAFPYYRDGVLVNVKYRTMDKRFWQVRGAEKVLYGLDDVAQQSEIVVVEGEMDKLAFEEAGVRNVVSVPDGAPSRVRNGDLPPESEDTKYAYLWNCRAWLDPAVRIVIATDNDAPGDALAEELARRLGRERCWRVKWPFSRRDHEYTLSAAGLSALEQTPMQQQQPEKAVPNGSDVTEGLQPSMLHPSEASPPAADNEEASLPEEPTLDRTWYRKDANEVLIRDGGPVLHAFYEAAEPLPIRGLLRFHEYYDDIMKHYFLELRDGQGASTGWPALDTYYRVVPGELTIVTGVPNSGKSEWIDALLCNLSELHGWTFALCSMEKRATDHARQLAEKVVGRPFFDLPYGRGMRRMTHEQLDMALDWVDDRFQLIRYEDDALPSVDWVLDIAKAAVYRYGIRGLVIDPYNELDHQRPASMSETEYVSQMLTKVKRFAQTAGVHVWFVAHPRQLREWRGQAPNLYDISGSAHFINKADNGIVVHRNRDPAAPSSAQVQILVRKVRNKAAGTIGDCMLEYERINGRYLDMGDGRPPRTSAPIRFQQGDGGNNQALGAARSDASLLPDPAVSRSEVSYVDGLEQVSDPEVDLAAGAVWVHADGTVSSDPPDAYNG
jgi:twinkle protein